LFTNKLELSPATAHLSLSKNPILHALSAFYRRERPKESACAPTVRIADQNVNENRREGKIVDMLNIASSGRKTSGKAGGKAVASSRK